MSYLLDYKPYSLANAHPLKEADPSYSASIEFILFVESRLNIVI